MLIMVLYHIFHIVDQTELDKSTGERVIQDSEYKDEATFRILIITAVSAVFQSLDLSQFGTVITLYSVNSNTITKWMNCVWIVVSHRLFVI